MPFQFDETWALFARDLEVRHGVRMTMYFFARKQPDGSIPVEKVPPGREVAVNPRDGIPYLRTKAPTPVGRRAAAAPTDEQNPATADGSRAAAV